MQKREQVWFDDVICKLAQVYNRIYVIACPIQTNLSAYFFSSKNFFLINTLVRNIYYAIYATATFGMYYFLTKFSPPQRSIYSPNPPLPLQRQSFSQHGRSSNYHWNPHWKRFYFFFVTKFVKIPDKIQCLQFL